MKNPSLFLASVGLAAASSVTAWSRNAESPVIPLSSVFEKSSTPAGALVHAVTVARANGGAGDPHPLLNLDAAFVPENGTAYVAFRAQDDATVPCSRSLAAGCCRFTPADPYQVELSATLRTAVLGSPATSKARWVRVASDGDLAALGLAGLRGTPVIASFGEEELAGAQFVALYRRKHWPSSAESQPGSCSGHTHMQVTWARLPTKSESPRD